AESKATGKPWLAIAFVAVYATLAAFAAPVSPLAYAAGAVWGFLKGAALVWTSSILGALFGYLLARGVWAEPARRLLGPYRDKIWKLGHDNAFLVTMRMRLLPVIPFGASSYAAAISKLSLPGFL